MATALDPHRNDGASRERAFLTSFAAWCAGMVLLIGGGSTVGVAAATGAWGDGLVVGLFLSVFIAPPLAGLLAGVLFVDREERAAASSAPARTVALAGPVEEGSEERRAA